MINLVAALAEGLKKKQHDYTWDEGKLHASDTSCYIDGSDGKCERQLWLRYHGYPREPEKPGTLLMFDQGNNLEEKVIKYIRRGLPDGYHVVAEQINIRNGLPDDMKGRLDFLLSDGDTYAIVDVKSVRGNAFMYMSDKAKPMHKMQVDTYIRALKTMFNIEIKTSSVIVVDREGQNLAQDFWWQHQDEDIERVNNALDYVQNIVKLEKPPKVLKPKLKINHNKGNDSVKVSLPWQCKYCDYRGVSCEGAIPTEFDNHLGKVCGHIIEDEFKEKYNGIGKFVNLEEVI